jgi:transcriptional regulator GlxA family with amidase domain
MNMMTMESPPQAAGRGFVSGSAEPGCGAEPAARIEQCVAYMSQHLNRPLQVATLAARVSISPSHFFALFKRRIGLAPMDYFTRLRMERAGQLLESTSLSVKEVAAELGYDDPFYFSRVFKSINQLAPSDYRAAKRAADGKDWAGRPSLNFTSEPQIPAESKRVQFA